MATKYTISTVVYILGLVVASISIAEENTMMGGCFFGIGMMVLAFVLSSTTYLSPKTHKRGNDDGL